MARQLERELNNRHIQLIAIGGAIGTGLFLGSGTNNSFNRTFPFTNLHDYWYGHVCIHASTWRIVIK